MTSATLDSEAAFSARLKAMSIDGDLTRRLSEGLCRGELPGAGDGRGGAQVGSAASGGRPFQLSCIRRLIFESHTYALADMQLRIEPQVDVHGLQARKLPPAEREARQKEQEKRLAGVMFTPETIPSHHLVDLCVEMAPAGAGDAADQKGHEAPAGHRWHH